MKPAAPPTVAELAVLAWLAQHPDGLAPLAAMPEGLSFKALLTLHKRRLVRRFKNHASFPCAQLTDAGRAALAENRAQERKG